MQDKTIAFSEDMSETYDYVDGQYVDGTAYTWTCSSLWVLEPYDSGETTEMKWTIDCYQPMPESSCHSDIHAVGSLIE